MYLWYLVPIGPALGRLVVLTAIFVSVAVPGSAVAVPGSVAPVPVPYPVSKSAYSGSAEQQSPQAQEQLVVSSPSPSPLPSPLQDPLQTLLTQLTLQRPLPLPLPLVAACTSYLPSAYPRVVCIRRYSAFMPGNFSRTVSSIVGHGDTYQGTSIPADASFSLASAADFLVFNEAQARGILGRNPRQEFIFVLSPDTHEGPVYIPESNELYISRLSPQYLAQLVVDLNSDPPRLVERTANPPIYAGAGARYHRGLVYYAALGGHDDLFGQIFRPGIYTLNTTSGQSTCLLNNYYGYYFNSVDDLDVSPDGDIWFTDNSYSYAKHMNTRAPQLAPGSYRFTPSTGLVTLVESTLLEPNGIAFSTSSRTLYISDTGAGQPLVPHGPIVYTPTGPRTIYAFNVSSDFKTLTNKRSIYHAMDYVPDGIKISRDGYLVVAAGHGVDVLTPEGEPVLRVNMNFTVASIAFVGRDGQELWAVGQNGAARVTWALRGPPV